MLDLRTMVRRSSNTFSASLKLYVMKADGTGIRRIPTGLSGVVEVAWGQAASQQAAAPTVPEGQRADTGAQAGGGLKRWCALQPKFVTFTPCRAAGA
jgi:hypothetical protein